MGIYLVLSRTPLQSSSFLCIWMHGSEHVLSSHLGHVYLATLKLHTSQLPNRRWSALKIKQGKFREISFIFGFQWSTYVFVLLVNELPAVEQSISAIFSTILSFIAAIRLLSASQQKLFLRWWLASRILISAFSARVHIKTKQTTNLFFHVRALSVNGCVWQLPTFAQLFHVCATDICYC